MMRTVPVMLLVSALFAAMHPQTATAITDEGSPPLNTTGPPLNNGSVTTVLPLSTTDCIQSGADFEAFFIATDESVGNKKPRYGYYRDKLLLTRLKNVYKEAGVPLKYGKGYSRCLVNRISNFTETAAIHVRVTCSLLDICDPLREPLREAVRAAAKGNSSVFLVR